MCQDEVEMALSMYNQQRLSEEAHRLENQHVRLAQAEAAASMGLGSALGFSEHNLLYRSRSMETASRS